jgi:hypothetical protein|nr:MAG TPA: hypothetical protein [Caudoviricetes sp.]
MKIINKILKKILGIKSPSKEIFKIISEKNLGQTEQSEV